MKYTAIVYPNATNGCGSPRAVTLSACWTLESDTLEIHHPKPQTQSQPSRADSKMWSNHQRSNSKQFHLPTQRRTNVSSPSRGSRTGVIDQTLIQGSQQPQYSSSSPRTLFNDFESSAYDEDPQLDAFGESAGLLSWQVLMEARSGAPSLGG